MNYVKIIVAVRPKACIDFNCITLWSLFTLPARLMDLSNYDNEINIITEKCAIPSIKYQVNLNMVSMLI